MSNNKVPTRFVSDMREVFNLPDSVDEMIYSLAEINKKYPNTEAFDEENNPITSVPQGTMMFLGGILTNEKGVGVEVTTVGDVVTVTRIKDEG